MSEVEAKNTRAQCSEFPNPIFRSQGAFARSRLALLKVLERVLGCTLIGIDALVLQFTFDDSWQLSALGEIVKTLVVEEYVALGYGRGPCCWQMISTEVRGLESCTSPNPRVSMAVHPRPSTILSMAVTLAALLLALQMMLWYRLPWTSMLQSDDMPTPILSTPILPAKMIFLEMGDVGGWAAMAIKQHFFTQGSMREEKKKKIGHGTKIRFLFARDLRARANFRFDFCYCLGHDLDLGLRLLGWPFEINEIIQWSSPSRQSFTSVHVRALFVGWKFS